MRPLALAVIAAACCAPVYAQWLDFPARGIPRGVNGSPNLTAPAPRNARRQVDLSGVWQATPDPNDPPEGTAGMPLPRYMLDIMRDLKGTVSLQPWAAKLYEQRQANKLRDNPMIKCLPAGVPRLAAYTHPYKIVQTPELIVILYESQTTFRQIFMDGRAHPEDPDPSWYGYSIGRWEGDTLVVDTTGFNDKTWLDGLGHPHSEQMRVTERYRRLNFGSMEISVTIDDPKTYTASLTYVQPQRLLADTDLIEYICNENAKPVGPP
jgi:hypothetical protein